MIVIATLISLSNTQGWHNTITSAHGIYSALIFPYAQDTSGSSVMTFSVETKKTTITDLPNELLWNIFQRLELPDLQSVRLLESTKLTEAADLFLFKQITTAVFTSHVPLQERFEGVLRNQ
jgi:hypothetical protein